MLNRLLTSLHLRHPVRAKSIETVDKPRSWWGTSLSLLAHGLIVALLWSAPAIDINPPEVPPPESIDATLLPPPPPESKPTPNLPTPSSTRIASDKIADPSPKATSDKQNDASLSNPDKNGMGNNQAANSGNGSSATKSLPKGNPIGVPAPNRGFDVDYELTGKFQGFDAAGSAKLLIRLNGDRYSADLTAKSTGASFSTRSGGVWRADTIATERFNELMDLPWPFNKSDKQSSFEVNYATRKIHFVNRGTPYERELTVDPIYDYLSAIAFLQAGFQSGHIKAGQGTITLPIGKRQDIGTASIAIGGFDSISTYDGAFDAIHAKISVDSTSIKSIEVWFVPEVNYEPRKMHIVFDKGVITLLSTKKKQLPQR